MASRYCYRSIATNKERDRLVMTECLPAIRVSIVVPVFCSAAILPHLVTRVATAMAGPGVELTMVDDASTDDSWEVIEQIVDTYSFVQGIRLARNVGQHNAIMAGLNHVHGDIVIIMDDDLQHPRVAAPFGAVPM